MVEGRSRQLLLVSDFRWYFYSHQAMLVVVSDFSGRTDRPEQHEDGNKAPRNTYHTVLSSMIQQRASVKNGSG